MPVIISEAENKEYDAVTPTLNINQEKTCKSNNTMSSKTDSFDEIYDAGNNNKPFDEHNHDKASDKINKDTKENACGLHDTKNINVNNSDKSMEEEETDVDGDCSENVECDSSDEIQNVVKEFSDSNEHKNTNGDCSDKYDENGAFNHGNEHVDKDSSDEYENADKCSNEHEDFDV